MVELDPAEALRDLDRCEAPHRRHGSLEGDAGGRIAGVLQEGKPGVVRAMAEEGILRPHEGHVVPAVSGLGQNELGGKLLHSPLSNTEFSRGVRSLAVCGAVFCLLKVIAPKKRSEILK